MKTMTSNRPYLIRAFYDWILDNGCTPYIVVDAYAPGVEVPQDYVQDGQIVLNLAPKAVMSFHLDKERIGFNTRFSGIPTDINIPLKAVLGIYAKENGQGMVFQPEETPPPGSPKPPRGTGPSRVPSDKKSGENSGAKDPKPPSRPNLKIIK